MKKVVSEKVLLVCSECGHHEGGYSDRVLMNKIKMWNHVRRTHPDFAEHYMEELKRLQDEVIRKTDIAQPVK